MHFSIIHDTANTPNYSTEEFAKKQILTFENNLRRIYPFSFSQHFDLLGSAISVEIIDTVSSILEEKCNAAFKEFSIPKKRKISKVDIRKAFDKHNKLHGSYTDFTSFAGYRHDDFVLIQALFTRKLQETYQWLCDSTLDHFKGFLVMIKKTENNFYILKKYPRQPLWQGYSLLQLLAKTSFRFTLICWYFPNFSKHQLGSNWGQTYLVRIPIVRETWKNRLNLTI